MIIPKIKIGRKSDRNFFDKSHDVNTTSDFGFCQPTLIEDVIADSKIDLKSSSFIRLAPLPVPTFGRINVKQHTAFVPHRDVFLAYDAFISQKTVQSGIRSYIPTENDTVNNNDLLSFLLTMTAINGRAASPSSATTTYPNLVSRSCPFRLAIYTNVPTKNEDIDTDNGKKLDYFRDPLYDCFPISSLENSQEFRNAVHIYDAIFGSSDISDSDPSKFSNFLDNLGIPYYDDYNFLSYNRYDGENTRCKFSWHVLANAQFDGQALPSILPPSNNIGNVEQIVTWQDEEKFACSEVVSPDSCDFKYVIEDDVIVRMWETGGLAYEDYNLKGSMICLKLTPYGRRLWKILTACRVNFGYTQLPVEMLPLFAYYKTWFDEYNPGRNYQWYDTHAYYLIHHFYDFGKTTQSLLTGGDTFTLEGKEYDSVKFKTEFASFLLDLGNCYYSLPADNITSATEQPLQNLESDELNNHPIYYGYGDGEPQVGQAQANYANPSYDSLYGRVYEPNAGQTDTVNAGGLGIQLLNRIYNYVNKNSVLGQRIDAYLKAHNLGSPLPDSLVLGDHDFPVYVEDQFSTAETEQGFLGEFAGKAKGYNAGKSMHLHTLNAGTLVQLFCVVPYGGYVQTSRIGRKNRMDFYNALFDSLGKEPLTHYEINGRSSVLNGLDTDYIFGFVPQYFRYKVANNLANGGFSLPSQRGVFLPYSLDRIFSEKNFIEKHKRNSIAQKSEAYYDLQNGAELVPDEVLRYIGLNEDFGNYNRIFYDVTGLTDNFIVQIVHDLKVYSPMKPVSESYDTFDKDNDNGVVNIDHA